MFSSFPLIFADFFFTCLAASWLLSSASVCSFFYLCLLLIGLPLVSSLQPVSGHRSAVFKSAVCWFPSWICWFFHYRFAGHPHVTLLVQRCWFAGHPHVSFWLLKPSVAGCWSCQLLVVRRRRSAVRLFVATSACWSPSLPLYVDILCFMNMFVEVVCECC